MQSDAHHVPAQAADATALELKDVIKDQNLQELRDLCSLLRLVFWQAPTRELLDRLASSNALTENSDTDRGLNMMRQAVIDNQNRLETYVEELAIEFTRLFIGPRHAPAIPYASFYMSERSQFMSEITIDVRRIYLDAGMAVRELNRIPDDHIAIELEFMAWLADYIDHALQQANQTEETRLRQILNTFIHKHVLTWMPVFAASIIQNSVEIFYKGAAQALAGILNEIQ